MIDFDIAMYCGLTRFDVGVYRKKLVGWTCVQLYGLPTSDEQRWYVTLSSLKNSLNKRYSFSREAMEEFDFNVGFFVLQGLAEKGKLGLV